MGIKDILLVANRGEIAIRICRSALELDIPTIAIYAYEDRFSDHFQYATESYLLGNDGELEPREAYMDIDRIMQIAKVSKATLIHPGYGFLSESEKFARAVEKAGLKFVGPSSATLHRFGNKVSARQIAEACQIPVVPGTKHPVTTENEVSTFIASVGLPIIAKAANGGISAPTFSAHHIMGRTLAQELMTGGGRGQRVIVHGQEAWQAVSRARSEAREAFDDEEVFLEKFLPNPKHVEVQILGDRYGNAVHLYERDCTVQRRHQKIIEYAPAVSLRSSLRKQLQDAALQVARHVRYENAATVEFLVQDDEFFFIEVNPRIQVEHTVTEQILNIDLIRAQILIAQGASLSDIGMDSHLLHPRGVAIQCRITSENPALGFIPSCGTIMHCRLPSGPGIRTDSSNMFSGARITPHYDSLLFKCISHAEDHQRASLKMHCALTECLVEGIDTNVSILRRILKDSRFLSHKYWTRLLDADIDLLSPGPDVTGAAEGLMAFFGRALVHGTQIQGQTAPPEFLGELETPTLLTAHGDAIDITVPSSNGWRKVLLAEGPVGFAKAVRKHARTLIMDTTWRDAQQSLLATRIRTVDIANIARHTSHAYQDFYAIEAWGGATFDVALRFLHEDPWKRLRILRELVPNVPFSMLLRSISGLAYSALPHNFLEFFVDRAVKSGIDIIRVFDGLNDVENLVVAIDACSRAGAVVEGSILYTGDILDPCCKYSLDYYMNIIDRMVAAGAHIVALKSMTGVMKPEAGRRLVHAIRSKHQHLPIHVHMHDAAGLGVATSIACAEAGADIIDTATDSMSGATSQPAATAVLSGLAGKRYEPEVDFNHVAALDSYWSQLRLMYSGYDAKLTGADPDVYKHEIPGGQLTNLIFQARELGLGGRWKETKEAFAVANKLLGDIVKATPTSKAVGDLAQFMVNSSLSRDDVLSQAETLDFPASVLDFLQGLMGQPFDGFPEPLRTQALRGNRQKIDCVASATLDPIDVSDVRRKLIAEYGQDMTDEDVCSYVMFPEVFVEYQRSRARFGDLTWLPTHHFLVPPKIGEEIDCSMPGSKALIVKPLALDGENHMVVFEVNGQFRQIVVDGVSSGSPDPNRRKADPLNPMEVGASFSATVSKVSAKAGDGVSEGQNVMSLSAMKMILDVSAPAAGVLCDLNSHVGDVVNKGDLLFTVTPSPK